MSKPKRMQWLNNTLIEIYPLILYLVFLFAMTMFIMDIWRNPTPDRWKIGAITGLAALGIKGIDKIYHSRN